MPKSTYSDRQVLRAILLAALILRVLTVVCLSALDFDAGGYEPGAHAKNLYEGKGYAFRWYGLYEEPVVGSFVPPALPGIMAAGLLLTDGDWSTTALLLQLLNVLLSVATVYLVWRIARQIVQMSGTVLEPIPRITSVWDLGRSLRRPDIGAAAFWTAYPPALGNVFEVRSQTLEAFLICWMTTLLLAAFLSKSPQRRCPDAPVSHYVTLGLLLGISVLVRPALGLIWVPWSVALLIRYRFSWAMLRSLLLVLATGVLVVSPWTIRNWNVHNAFVPIATNGGFNFHMGNNAYSGGEIGHVHRVFARMSPEERRAWRELSEVEKDRRFYRLGWEYWKQEPWRAFKGAVLKSAYFLGFRPAFLHMHPPAVVLIYVVSYVPLLLGFLLAVRTAREFGPLMLYLPVLTMLFVSCIYIVSMRFRVSVEPLMLVVAANWVLHRHRRE